MTAFTVTATNSAGSTSTTVNLTTCATTPTSEWVPVSTTSTLDLLALYPTATSFQFIAVGGGGGGVGGFSRAVVTNSMYAQAGGSSGAVSTSTVARAGITGAVTFTVGAGGAGGAGAPVKPVQDYSMGFKGGDGGNSVVSVGASTLLTAGGGKGIANQSNNSLWPFAGTGTLYNSSTAQGVSGSATTTVGVNDAVEAATGYSTSTFKTIGANSPAWTVTASGPGAGGTSAGMANNGTAYTSQDGQAAFGN